MTVAVDDAPPPSPPPAAAPGGDNDGDGTPNSIDGCWHWGGSTSNDGCVARPTTATRPNVNADVNLFWRGGDNALYEAYGDPRGGLAGWFRLGFGPLGSQPSAAKDNAGRHYVYWKGTENSLWQSWWTLGYWEGPHNRGMGPLGSPPSVAVHGPDSTAHVFWRGTDNQLWEAWGNAMAALRGPNRIGMGPIGSQPAVAKDVEGRQYVYWKGTDNNLWEAYWTGSRWVGPYNRGMGPLGSPPAVAIRGYQVHVFWRGTDGHLWEAWGDPRGNLNGPNRLGFGTLGSPPSAGKDANGHPYVYWRGTDANIWQAYWTGSHWTGPHYRGMGPLGG